MKRAFVDTSAWFAYINGADPDHRSVERVLSRPGTRLVTTNFVFDEVVTLCLYRLGHSVAAKVGGVLLAGGFLDLIRVTTSDEKAAWALFLARPDKSYSFTDCTSFVAMRRLGIPEAVALDADFRREGFASFP
jgi:predicted nucleic acid-binding protein